MYYIKAIIWCKELHDKDVIIMAYREMPSDKKLNITCRSDYDKRYKALRLMASKAEYEMFQRFHLAELED